MIVLIMGVEGAGKSTVGAALAGQLRWRFCEGDDFHTVENKAKMHMGIALTDADREPWLAALHLELAKWQAAGISVVLAASTLRDRYRRQLFAHISVADYRIVYLYGPSDILAQRVQERVGHFASAAMLQSQLDILEPPRNAIAISIAQSVGDQVKEIRSVLER